MTLKPSFLAAAAFLVAGGLSGVAAQTIARVLEDRSVESVEAELRAQGFTWASVLGDGLQVVLEGEAPTEADRFNAISAASEVVDGARVIDNLRVAESEPLAPPEFELEILRNDTGVSLIGLVPADVDHRAMMADVQGATGGQDLSDLLQVADYPVPEGWEAAFDYAVDALELLPRAKISVGPGRVSIEAISDSAEERRRLESTLATLKPDGLRLALSVSAPRPVISPFTFRARLDDGRLVLDACSAETGSARDDILSAAAAAGAEGPLACRLGLGSPSPAWGEAVSAGLAALRGVGGGTLTISDLDVNLIVAPGTGAALFDRLSGELDGALPDGFVLRAERPIPATAEEPDRGPPEFVAALGEDGKVRLSGRIDDERMNGLARAFAQARFGAEDVILATRPGAEGLPNGWAMRVLAGIEALSQVAQGSVTVTPDRVSVEGRTGIPDARDEIAARAIETLGPGAALDIRVTYDEALDPLAALPTPEECLTKITAVTDAAKITFDPGSATISREGEPVIKAVVEILRSCPDLRLRISGYTDSQGRESSNLELSQFRADAVLAALRAERVPVAGFEAEGFGEASPIASNDTEEGRERNRRIEFTLLQELPASPVVAVPEGASPAADPRGASRPPQPMAEAPDAPPLRPRTFALPEGQETTEVSAPGAGSEDSDEEGAAPDDPRAEGEHAASDAEEPDRATGAATADPGPALVTTAPSSDPASVSGAAPGDAGRRDEAGAASRPPGGAQSQDSGAEGPAVAEGN